MLTAALVLAGIVAAGALGVWLADASDPAGTLPYGRRHRGAADPNAVEPEGDAW